MTMSKQNVSLETEIELEQLQRFLIQNPDKAHELAMNYYKDCLALARYCEGLEAEAGVAQRRKIPSPSLPPFKAKRN